MHIDTKMASQDSSHSRFLHIGRGNGGVRRSRIGDERGQALVEFALVLPILLLFVIGIFKFGIALNNYLTLTNSANLAAQVLAVNAGGASDPCALASAAVDHAAPFLTPGNINYTITVTQVTGTSTTVVSNQASPSCPSDSSDFTPSSTSASQPTVTVELTYPCNLNLLGFNFGGGNCLLTAQTAEQIQ